MQVQNSQDNYKKNVFSETGYFVGAYFITGQARQQMVSDSILADGLCIAEAILGA